MLTDRACEHDSIAKQSCARQLHRLRQQCPRRPFLAMWVGRTQICTGPLGHVNCIATFRSTALAHHPWLQ